MHFTLPLGIIIFQGSQREVIQSVVRKCAVSKQKLGRGNW